MQSKFEAHIKKHNKSPHQQSLLLNDTDVVSDDENRIYTRIPKDATPFLRDATITSENFSTITNPKSDTLSTNAIEPKHPNDYSLDILTLKQQQAQDQVLKTVYSWITKKH